MATFAHIIVIPRIAMYQHPNICIPDNGIHHSVFVVTFVLQPYAEVGPIFLHKKTCERYTGEKLPAYFDLLEPAIIRGYDENDWIRYDTGQVVSGRDLAETSHSILSDLSINYVHIRSRFNCFQCRVERIPQ